MSSPSVSSRNSQVQGFHGLDDRSSRDAVHNNSRDMIAAPAKPGLLSWITRKKAAAIGIGAGVGIGAGGGVGIYMNAPVIGTALAGVGAVPLALIGGGALGVGAGLGILYRNCLNKHNPQVAAFKKLLVCDAQTSNTDNELSSIHQWLDIDYDSQEFKIKCTNGSDGNPVIDPKTVLYNKYGSFFGRLGGTTPESLCRRLNQQVLEDKKAELLKQGEEDLSNAEKFKFKNSDALKQTLNQAIQSTLSHDIKVSTWRKAISITLLSSAGAGALAAGVGAAISAGFGAVPIGVLTGLGSLAVLSAFNSLAAKYVINNVTKDIKASVEKFNFDVDKFASANNSSDIAQLEEEQSVPNSNRTSLNTHQDQNNTPSVDRTWQLRPVTTIDSWNSVSDFDQGGERNIPALEDMGRQAPLNGIGNVKFTEADEQHLQSKGGEPDTDSLTGPDPYQRQPFQDTASILTRSSIDTLREHESIDQQYSNGPPIQDVENRNRVEQTDLQHTSSVKSKKAVFHAGSSRSSSIRTLDRSLQNKASHDFEFQESLYKHSDQLKRLTTLPEEELDSRRSQMLNSFSPKVQEFSKLSVEPETDAIPPDTLKPRESSIAKDFDKILKDFLENVKDQNLSNFGAEAVAKRAARASEINLHVPKDTTGKLPAFEDFIQQQRGEAKLNMLRESFKNSIVVFDCNSLQEFAAKLNSAKPGDLCYPGNDREELLASAFNQFNLGQKNPDYKGEFEMQSRMDLDHL